MSPVNTNIVRTTHKELETKPSTPDMPSAASGVDITESNSFPIEEVVEWECEYDGSGKPKRPLPPSHMFYNIHRYLLISYI